MGSTDAAFEHPRIVFCVDPGTRGLGWFTTDTVTKAFNFGTAVLVAPDARYKKDAKLSWANMRKGFAAWLEVHRDRLEACDVLVVESQHNKSHATALTCAQVSYFVWTYPHKLVLYAPSTVAKHYGFENLGRAAKKAATMRLCTAELGVVPQTHDAADAWLLYAHWQSKQ
jgi:Holliday junction resolvasome RuvABC endonuclease subunit